QRTSIAAAAPAGPASASGPANAPAEPLDIDWTRFGEQFRGSEDRIREQQKRYVERFAGAPGVVLDLGCGRGEFLEAARSAGLTAPGRGPVHAVTDHDPRTT